MPVNGLTQSENTVFVLKNVDECCIFEYTYKRKRFPIARSHIKIFVEIRISFAIAHVVHSGQVYPGFGWLVDSIHCCHCIKRYGGAPRFQKHDEVFIVFHILVKHLSVRVQDVCLSGIGFYNIKQ